MRKSLLLSHLKIHSFVTNVPLTKPVNFNHQWEREERRRSIKDEIQPIFVWPCKQASKQLYVAELTSCHETKVRSTSTLTATITRHNDITVNVPFITIAIPVGIIFRALGILSISEMVRFILPGRWKHDLRLLSLIRSVLENYVYKDDPVLQSDQSLNDPTELHDWIGRRGTKEATREKRIKYVEHIFGNEFLPHIGLERTRETVRRKIYMFGLFNTQVVSGTIGTIATRRSRSCRYTTCWHHWFIDGLTWCDPCLEIRWSTWPCALKRMWIVDKMWTLWITQ